MKIDIDINKIVEKIDVNKIVEEKIISDILDDSKLEDIVDGALDNEDMKTFINAKVFKVVENYLSSEEGKKYIIERFESAITDSDVLTDDKIIELVADFLKTSLAERLK